MPDALTRKIAGRVRMARWLRGQRQEELARRIGVSFQQIQKYETGVNRIPSNRLCRIAGALGVSAAWLLDTADEAPCDRETAELAAAYSRLPDPARATVRSLVGLLGSAAKAAEGKPADSFDFRDPIGW